MAKSDINFLSKAEEKAYITERNFEKFLNVRVEKEYKGGDRIGYGLKPRNYRRNPVGSYRGIPAMAIAMPIAPEVEQAQAGDESAIKGLIAQMEGDKSRLSDIILASNGGTGYPSLDQDGQGYCWAYSTTGCVMTCRDVMGQPHVRLSAHAVACVIKNFRNEGGWGALSAEFMVERGVPSVQLWPEKSMSRTHDNPATWANAKQHIITANWMDLEASVYDRNLTKAQLATCLLNRIPCVVDYNWWGHSIFAVDLVSWNPFRIRIRNSWTDSWGERGFGILEASKAVPDGALGVRAVSPSIN